MEIKPIKNTIEEATELYRFSKRIFDGLQFIPITARQIQKNAKWTFSLREKFV